MLKLKKLVADNFEEAGRDPDNFPFAMQRSIYVTDESGGRGASRRPSSHTTGHTFYVPRRFPSVCNARYLSATGTRPCRTNQARVMASVAW